MRLSLRNGFQSAQREIATSGLPEVDREAYGGLAASFTYDDRDREALATHGWLARSRYYRGLDWMGSRRDYDRFEGILAKSWNLDGDVLLVRATGGAHWRGELPFYDVFTLGGPMSFPGLAPGQLRGTSYWTTSAAYLRGVVDISALFGQRMYLGASLAAGDMAGRVDGIREEPTFGAALLFGGQTPLGPLTLSAGATSTDDWSLFLTLGRPVEERNVVDATW